MLTADILISINVMEKQLVGLTNFCSLKVSTVSESVKAAFLVKTAILLQLCMHSVYSGFWGVCFFLKVKSPDKSSPKKCRMSSNSSPPPAITIILEDTENFPASVLQDFVVTCRLVPL